MHSKETQALMEAAVDAVIVIDHQGLMSAINQAARQLFGYSSDELLGNNVSMLMPSPDKAAHDGYMRHYRQSGEARIIGIGREVFARRKDGSLFPAWLSVGRVPDSDPPRFVGLVRDLTAEHEATAALRLERDRANAYLELNDAILLMLDPERRVREINARGSELLGAPRDEIRGRDWLELIAIGAERDRAALMLEGALSAGGSHEREYDAITFDGERRRIYWRCIALRATDGTPSGWLVSGADVTDRARREEHAAMAQDRLTRVARLASMGEMATGVAHELNQPLTAITTYARACERFLARNEPDFEELKEAVREIGAEGLRAGRIINRLRQLVRSDEPAALAPLDLNSVIEDLRAFLGADARAFDTEVDLLLAPTLPRVRGDAVQLQQVILNLVRNSFEALGEMPAGQRRVQVRTQVKDGDVELTVSDNGPGFPAEMAGRVFHPFATTKKSGTGLGLAMSRTLVQAHGGRIGTGGDSSGAQVFVRLPALEGNA